MITPQRLTDLAEMLERDIREHPMGQHKSGGRYVSREELLVLVRGYANTVGRGEAMPRPYEVDHRGAPSPAVEREIVVGSTWRARYFNPGTHWEIISITEPPQYDGALERPFRLLEKTGGMQVVMPESSVRDNYTWVSNPQPESPDARPESTDECQEDAASCDCSWHENLKRAEESHREPEPTDPGVVPRPFRFRAGDVVRVKPNGRTGEVMAIEEGFNHPVACMFSTEPKHANFRHDQLELLETIASRLRVTPCGVVVGEGERVDPGVIRAAEGVVLEAGATYAIVSLGTDDRPDLSEGSIVIAVAQKGTRNPWIELTPDRNDLGDNMCWYACGGGDGTWVTAVRRVQEQAPQAEAATGELYVPAVGERVRVVEVASFDATASHVVGQETGVGSHSFPGTNLTTEPKYHSWFCLKPVTGVGGLGTWCRVEPVTEPIAPATPRSEPAAKSMCSGCLRWIGTATNECRVGLEPGGEFHSENLIQCLRVRIGNYTDQRDEALAKLQAHTDADGIWQSQMEAKVAEHIAANEALMVANQSLAVARDQWREREQSAHRRAYNANAELQATRAKVAELTAANEKSDRFQRAIAEAFGMVHEPDSGPTWPASWEALADKAASLAAVERERNELSNGQHDLLANLEECQSDLRAERRKLRVVIEDCDHAVKTRDDFHCQLSTRTAELEAAAELEKEVERWKFAHTAAMNRFALSEQSRTDEARHHDEHHATEERLSGEIAGLKKKLDDSGESFEALLATLSASDEKCSKLEAKLAGVDRIGDE